MFYLRSDLIAALSGLQVHDLAHVDVGCRATSRRRKHGYKTANVITPFAHPLRLTVCPRLDARSRELRLAPTVLHNDVISMTTERVRRYGVVKRRWPEVRNLPLTIAVYKTDIMLSGI